jgi:hypothetical protein
VTGRPGEQALLEAARDNDGDAFGRLVEPYRAELHAQRRPRRLLSADYGPAFERTDDLGQPVAEPVWLEPYPTPECRYELRESVELAFVAALQRARKAAGERVPHPSQQAELAALGTGGRRQLVDALVAAWERADVPAILELLADDARFLMPPCRPGSRAATASAGSSPSGCSPPPGGWSRSRPTGSWPSPATRAMREAAGSGSAR